MQKTLLEINQYLQQGDQQRASFVAKLHTFKNNDILYLLQNLQSQMQDAITIANAPKVPEVNENEVLSLLSKTRKFLSQIEQHSKSLEEQAKILQQEFPQNFTSKLSRKYKKIQKTAESKKIIFTKIIEDAQQQINSNNLAKALKILENKKEDSGNLQTEISKLYKHIKKLVAKLQKDKQQNFYVTHINNTIDKLRRYSKKIDARVLLTKKRLQNFRIKYPANLGYTQVSKYTDVLAKANRLIKNNLKIIKKVQRYQKHKKICKCI